MAIVVVAGMVRGAWLGITWQLASIASLILGYVVSHQASAQFAPYFPGEPEVARSLAMAVVYVVVSASVFGLARLIRGVLHKLKFEAYDRHLGMLLGGSEAACLGMLVTMFVVSLAPATRQPIFSSPTGRVVGTVMNNLGPVLPHEVRKVLAPHWDGSSALVVDNVTTEPSDAPAPGHSTETTATNALPAVHEAQPANGHGRHGAGSDLPALPPLEAAPGNDPEVQSARHSSSTSLGQRIEQTISHTIDDELHRLVPLEPAPRERPR
jgi:membrane protein required for colicin V production